MSKTRRAITVVVLIIIAGALVYLIQAGVKKYTRNSVKSQKSEQITPPITSVVPKSLTPGIETLTGTLALSNDKAEITVASKKYTVKVNGQSAVNFFNSKGYKTGDTVNVMGKINGTDVEMVGANKLVK